MFEGYSNGVTEEGDNTPAKNIVIGVDTSDVLNRRIREHDYLRQRGYGHPSSKGFYTYISESFQGAHILNFMKTDPARLKELKRQQELKDKEAVDAVEKRKEDAVRSGGIPSVPVSSSNVVEVRNADTKALLRAKRKARKREKKEVKFHIY